MNKIEDYLKVRTSGKIKNELYNLKKVITKNKSFFASKKVTKIIKRLKKCQNSKYYNIDETSKNNIDKIIKMLESESDEDLLTLVTDTEKEIKAPIFLSVFCYNLNSLELAILFAILLLIYYIIFAI